MAASRVLAAALCCLAIAHGAVEAAVQIPSTNSTEVPSFVLLSHDDALLDSSWRIMWETVLQASDARNPNGCRIPVTWFVGKQGRDAGSCAAVQQAYSKGHEIATHTLSHSDNWINFTLEEYLADIEGVRTWLNGSCGIPHDVMTGFRAPDFAASDLMGDALAKLGFQYDSSVQELNYTQRPGRLDDPNFQLKKCKKDVCLSWEGLPFWEVPIYCLPPCTGRRTNPVDMDGMTAVQRLQADFDRKRGLGVPTLIMAHEPYLRESGNATNVVTFLKWANQQPNTWFLTYQQLIAYYSAPPGTSIYDVMDEFPCDES